MKAGKKRDVVSVRYVVAKGRGRSHKQIVAASIQISGQIHVDFFNVVKILDHLVGFFAKKNLLNIAKHTCVSPLLSVSWQTYWIRGGLFWSLEEEEEEESGAGRSAG